MILRSLLALYDRNHCTIFYNGGLQKFFRQIYLLLFFIFMPIKNIEVFFFVEINIMGAEIF